MRTDRLLLAFGVLLLATAPLWSARPASLTHAAWAPQLSAGTEVAVPAVRLPGHAWLQIGAAPAEGERADAVGEGNVPADR